MEVTVTAYLQELVNQKKALANNLIEKGIQASEDEKFNTLVPKVLDVSGGNPYEGEYTITPSIQEQEMLTQNKIMNKNVTIQAIPYYETSNMSGKTVIIGGN